MTLEEIQKVAVPACREFQVKRLECLGSRARGAHTAERDVALLVEFEEPDRTPASDASDGSIISKRPWG